MVILSITEREKERVRDENQKIVAPLYLAALITLNY